MKLAFGINYEQQDPGWYIWDEQTGLVTASSDTDPTPEQLIEINQWEHLRDIFELIKRDKDKSFSLDH